jgi:catechol 2,3-dioxygenase-like lactoylglutathione lyase family enzyme
MLTERRAHATLPSQDPGTLRRFYEDILGFRPFAEVQGAVLYRAGDGSLFAISRTTITARGGHTQMAFTVPDIDVEVAELRAHGVVFEEYESPQSVGGIARIGAGRAAWFKDPEANLIGLIQFDQPV